MPERRTCDYTGEEIEPGTGIMYVRQDGTVLHFKDAKAEKNYFMGREAADLEWTGADPTDEGTATEPEAADEPAGTGTASEDGEDSEDSEETDAAETGDEPEDDSEAEVEAEAGTADGGEQ